MAVRLGLALAGVSAIVAVGACSSDHTPHALPAAPGGWGGSGGIDFDGGSGPPPADADASGICGNEVHPIIVDAPNLYFVLDASGSMKTLAGSLSRYDAVRVAAVNLVRTLGPLINVGAALFPHNVAAGETCHAGKQVFPVTPGDPITGQDGPTTTGFRLSTATVPAGGTPTAATLVALAPTLEALTGKTFVLLATDGAPNCNPNAQCTAAACTTNIDGDCGDGSVNCCAPGGATGPASCIDESATIAAIKALAAANIPVYVIGIPGSEIYADVLSDMAIAGGAPASQPPYYYKVDQIDNVEQVFGSIADVVVTCVFQLEDAPPDPTQTNVYFDQQVVAYDEVNGWHWTSPTTVTVEGTACERLKKGEVKQVQIVSGCPTEMPK